jgi:hypothetical protein
MTLSRRAVFWAPRALSILFIGVVSVFALDVFGEGYGFWQTIGALIVHLAPALIMAAALATAWRWEWVGAAAFSLFALLFAWAVRGPAPVKAFFTVPCLAAAGLFLLSWRRKCSPRLPGSPSRGGNSGKEAGR